MTLSPPPHGRTRVDLRASFEWRGPNARGCLALSWIAFAVYALLLTLALGAREFWTDEIVSAGHVSHWVYTDDPFHPRAYYVLLYGWKLIFGDGDLALRAFSIPWALAAFWLLTAIGKRLLDHRALILGQWLFALSPYVILYFRMARFYSMVTAVALAVAYCAVLVLQEGRRRHWTALAAGALALLFTNYSAVAMLVLLFAVLLFAALIPPARRHRHLGRLALCVLPTAVAAAIIVHGMGGEPILIRTIETGLQSSVAMRIVSRLALPLYALALGETTDPWRLYVTLPALAAAAVALVLGLAARRQKPGYALIAGAWPVVVVASAAILVFAAPAEPLASATRISLFSAPLAYLAMASGLRQIRRGSLRVLLVLILFGADLYGLGNCFHGRQFLNPSFVVPWREIGATIERQQRPDDIAVAYYDSTIKRYAALPNFIDGRPDYFPELLAPVDEWPKCGCRLWLIARDRGSAEARRLQQGVIDRLTPLASKVTVTPFMPYTPTERKWRGLFLGQDIPDAYVKIYLFEPPR
jgi:hypothetical protein